MRLVGFGCSFTYGSELQSPDLDPADYWENSLYRESHVWLGLLADRLGSYYNNLAEPANSNFAIAHQVADYVLNYRNSNETIIICVAWTERTRMSWFGDSGKNDYGDSWTHNGFAGDQHGWSKSAREWVINSTSKSHDMFTDNSKLFVNNLCQVHNIPILQFNALGNHKTTRYPNYFLDGITMESVLKDAQKSDDRLNLFASGGHPNEAGHEYFTIRLHDFAKERII